MIPPGLLTGSSVDAVNQAIESAKETERRLDAMRQSLPTEFPAKITAYDSTTGACDWTLRAYNANGLRIDHHSGMTGSSTWMPAYPTGNGEMPPPSFPVDVWMRQRLGSSEKGPIFEFDWHCACTAATVGSSGGGSVLSDCCPNPIPETLYAVITAINCVLLNGVTVTLVNSSNVWYGSKDLGGGSTLTLNLICSSTTNLWGTAFGINGGCVLDLASPNLDVDSHTCDPFSAEVTYTAGALTTCCNVGETIVITITE